MIDLYKLTTPLYGTTNIEAADFIDQLKLRLRHAEDDNKHHNYNITRYIITIDVEGQLWLSGETNENV